MNVLSREKHIVILRCLFDGASIRANTRIAGVAINTFIKLLIYGGKVCDKYQDRMLQNLTPKRLELDEIWSFCYAKERQIPTIDEPPPGAGHVWTWVALDPVTKLVLRWWVGDRERGTCWEFIEDLRSRIKSNHLFQITTDGF